MKHDIGCDCLDCMLECWSMPDASRRFRDAAFEIRELRKLIDAQISAMNGCPMGDLNYAGLDWLHAAQRMRRGSCRDGWIQCSEDNPCAKHAEYWYQYANQGAQIPGRDA